MLGRSYSFVYALLEERLLYRLSTTAEGASEPVPGMALRKKQQGKFNPGNQTHTPASHGSLAVSHPLSSPISTATI